MSGTEDWIPNSIRNLQNRDLSNKTASIEIYSHILVKTYLLGIFFISKFCIHRSDIQGHFALLPALDTSGSGFYVSL